MNKSISTKSLIFFMGVILTVMSVSVEARSNKYSNNGHHNSHKNHHSSNNGHRYSNIKYSNYNSGYNKSSRFYNKGHRNSYRNYNHIGYRTSLLPLGYLALSLAGLNYYYHSGAYYRPVGHEYAVVRPPLGIGISILPAGYRTHRYGRDNYYSANGVFYHWNNSRRNYVVVNDPGLNAAAGTTNASVAEQFVYPRKGQNPDQSSRDQYECYLWAVEQTGVEPSQVNNPGEINNLNNYQRANGACLEARGYSVK